MRAKSKKEIRLAMLALMNTDPDWHKKENTVTRKIQLLAQELERPTEDTQLMDRLSVDDFLYLVSEDYLSDQIAWMHHLTKNQLTEWRSLNGFRGKRKEQILEENGERITEIRKKKADLEN